MLAYKAALTPRTYSYEYSGTQISRDEYDLLVKQGLKPSMYVDKLSIDYPGFIGVLIRKTHKQLERNLKVECDKIYRYFGGVYKEKQSCYIFPSGAKIYLVHLKDRKALDNFIGGNYHFLGVDEVNQFPYDWIEELETCTRTTEKDLRPQICYASNPGNIGHKWLFERFVSRCPPIPDGDKVYSEEFDVYYQPMETAEPYVDDEGIIYEFIPATVFDNPSILENDPAYVRRLKKLNPVLRALWLEGRWDVFAGMFFDNWDETIHVIDNRDFVFGRDFKLDTHKLYRFYDYGTRAPFVCLFAAYSEENGLIIFDEIVESGLGATKQAMMINKYTAETYGLSPEDFEEDICDPRYDIKASEDARGELVSAMDIYEDHNILLTPGNNDRTQGAALVYESFDFETDPDGSIIRFPKLRITDSCEYLIKTIPYLPVDKKNQEDVDTDSEDHGYDALRYGCTQVLSGMIKNKEKQKKGWREELKEGKLDSRPTIGNVVKSWLTQ